MTRTERLLAVAACVSTACFVMSLEIPSGDAACDPAPEEEVRISFDGATPAPTAERRQQLEALDCTLSRVDDSPDATISCRVAGDGLSDDVIEANLRRVDP